MAVGCDDIHIVVVSQRPTSRAGGGSRMARLCRHALVIGASMGGLLAARALADRYDEVTIVERDALAESHKPRKGVPQGSHTHGLLARGREAIEQLFPGVSEEITAQGAISIDLIGEFLWFNHGCYLHS